MQPQAWRWLPFVALLACLAVQAQAAPEAAADARAWLARINGAANSANYQGTMVFSAGGSISSSRVGHYAVGDQTYEHLEALDGRQQRVLRHNDAVHTVWPQSRVTVVERRETLAGWSTTPQEVDPRALEQYDFKREGNARVAGREAAVILLEPRDALRYAMRLWADLATGLMLRADVMGPPSAPGGGRLLLESTAFSEVLIGMKPQAESVLSGIRNLRKQEGWRVLRPQQQRTTLEAEGFVLVRPVPGFRLTGCVRRGMETTGDDATPVLQAVFSDGLTHVSLFVEPFAPQRHRGEMQARQGATGTLMTRRGDQWITVVGDVPSAALSAFAEALDRRKP